MTKNTRLSTPAQLQFRVPERGSLGTRLHHAKLSSLAFHTTSSGVREPGNEAKSPVCYSVAVGIVSRLLSVILYCYILLVMAPLVFIAVWTPMIVWRWRRPSLPLAVSVNTLVLLLLECVRR